MVSLSGNNANHNRLLLAVSFVILATAINNALNAKKTITLSIVSALFNYVLALLIKNVFRDRLGVKGVDSYQLQLHDGRSGHLLHSCTSFSFHNFNNIHGTKRAKFPFLAMPVTR